jgi:hypothetical protein
MVAESELLSGDVELRDLDLTALGTYTISVAAPGEDPSRVGDYQLHLADRDPEPRSIGFGESLAGSLDVRGKVQLFDLQVGSSHLGKPFTVALDGDQWVRPVLELLSPTGEVVQTASFGTSIADTRIADFVTDQVGSHQIRVTALSDTLGFFEVGVSDRPIETPQEIPFSQFTAGNLDPRTRQRLGKSGKRPVSVER